MGPAVAIVGLGLGLVGIAGEVISGLGAAESEAVAAESVAGFQEIEARSIEEAAAADEAADRRRTARALGKLRAQGAATGVDPSSGSLLLLNLDSAKEAELSALNIRQRGALRAFEKRVGAKLSRQRAEIARGRKGGIIAGGIFKGGSLLAGFAGGPGPSAFAGSGGGGTTASVIGAGAAP
jgi:hypothetical protein